MNTSLTTLLLPPLSLAKHQKSCTAAVTTLWATGLFSVASGFQSEHHTLINGLLGIGLWATAITWSLLLTQQTKKIKQTGAHEHYIDDPLQTVRQQLKRLANEDQGQHSNFNFSQQEAVLH